MAATLCTMSFQCSNLGTRPSVCRNSCAALLKSRMCTHSVPRDACRPGFDVLQSRLLLAAEHDAASRSKASFALGSQQQDAGAVCEGALRAGVLLTVFWRYVRCFWSPTLPANQQGHVWWRPLCHQALPHAGLRLCEPHTKARQLTEWSSPFCQMSSFYATCVRCTHFCRHKSAGACLCNETGRLNRFCQRNACDLYRLVIHAVFRMASATLSLARFKVLDALC